MTCSGASVTAPVSTEWEDEAVTDDGRYDSCPDCTCCTNFGCHTGSDSDCGWSDRLGDYTCPCTCE